MNKYISLIILWGFTLSVYAAPLRYNLPGQLQFRELDGSYVQEEFTGSLVLSDTIIMDPISLGNDAGQTHIITDFSITSANHAITQTSGSGINTFWNWNISGTELI